MTDIKNDSIQTLLDFYEKKLSADSNSGANDLRLTLDIFKVAVDLSAKPIRDNHEKMMNLIDDNNLYNIDVIKKYLDEYEEEMCIDTVSGKAWFDKDCKIHRVIRDANGKRKPARISSFGDQYWYEHGKFHMTDKDENGMTYPANILTNGEKIWFQNGEFHREDRDKFGNLLPTRTEGNSKVWYWHGKLHHAELGNDPADEYNFGKPLPAFVCNGKISYHYEGKIINRDALAAKINSKIKKIEITSKNGSSSIMCIR